MVPFPLKDIAYKDIAYFAGFTGGEAKKNTAEAVFFSFLTVSQGITHGKKKNQERLRTRRASLYRFFQYGSSRLEMVTPLLVEA